MKHDHEHNGAGRQAVARLPHNAAPPKSHRLERDVFATSRLIEFCSLKELTAQTGHPPEQWPLVILKELADNALDEAEKVGGAPVVNIEVKGGDITVADNGPGIAAETVAKILDFTVRASDKEAYVSPTRGAQGNALKTIVAMPFALDGGLGETVIEAHGIAHRITFTVDRIRQAPKVAHDQERSSVRKGTRVTVRWPNCALLKTGQRQATVFTNRRRPHLAQPAPCPAGQVGWAPGDQRRRRRFYLAQVAAVRSHVSALVQGGTP
jgi:Histidine kinase-, DNA gyrase B-, and HSP90-like ATPase